MATNKIRIEVIVKESCVVLVRSLCFFASLLACITLCPILMDSHGGKHRLIVTNETVFE